MIKVGLIGFGFAGRTFHAPFITAVPGLQLEAIVQRSGHDAAQLYPSVRIFQSLEDLLANGKLELVVVATPNTSHFPIARKCLEHGCHVVIDKPFTVTTAEARELIEVAQSQRKILSVYQNRRWDGDFMTVRRLIQGGDLGRVVLFESHFDRFRPEVRAGAWREKNDPGSGVLFDLSPHLLDQAITLFGVPEFVQADVRAERSNALIDDTFNIVLFYPGLRAVLQATMLAKIPGPRFTLHGTSGTFVKHGMDPQEDALKAGGTPREDSWGTEAQENWGVLDIEGQEVRRVPTEAGDYRGFYQNVREAINGSEPLAVTPQQALNVMIALELCNKSSREGCRVPWKD
jgi:scyllo-inositol 2-dehydrogenase (NADP+)